MNFETMELDELKEYAKSLGITFGKIGKEKLIEKIKEHEKNESTISSVIEDEDLDDKIQEENEEVEEENKGSLLDSITSAIDDLEDSTGGDVEPIVDLPIDTLIGVKSITFGGLTYKSKTNNAIFRWNQIGAVEYMTVGQLNEMNNYKTDFLRRP